MGNEYPWKKEGIEDEVVDLVLYRSANRLQSISHAISSLEKPTLENVEALKVHKKNRTNLDLFRELRKRSCLR